MGGKCTEEISGEKMERKRGDYKLDLKKDEDRDRNWGQK